MKDKKISLSPAFSYSTSKALDGRTDAAGSTALWATRAHKIYGAAPESLVPSNFKTDEEMRKSTIPIEAFLIAQKFRLSYYQRLYTLEDFAYALNKEDDKPGVCSMEFDIFESISSAPNGHVSLPRIGEKQIGSHCVSAHKYIIKEDGNKYIAFSNSWGTEWGEKGWGFLPITYFEHGLINSGWACDMLTPKSNMKTYSLKTREGVAFQVERNWYPPLRYSQYNLSAWDIYDSNNMPIGHIHASPMNETDLEIEEMYILPQYQGHGFGSKTLGVLEAAARSYKFSKIVGWVGAQDLVSGRRGRVLRFLKKAHYNVLEDNSRFKDAVYKFEKKIEQ